MLASAALLPASFSPGHVMGLATWKAVLQEHQRCPFTKNPLSVEQVSGWARLVPRAEHAWLVVVPAAGLAGG